MMEVRYVALFGDTKQACYTHNFDFGFDFDLTSRKRISDLGRSMQRLLPRSARETATTLGVTVARRTRSMELYTQIGMLISCGLAKISICETCCN